MADIVEIGPCDYAEPTDDGADECPNMGRALTLNDPLGFRVKRFLCRDHSDWIEAER